MAKTHNLQYHVTMIEELKSHLTHHLDLIYIHVNTAAHIRIVLIVAVHYAVKQGGKSSVNTLLNTLTPEQQLQFLSTKDKKDESGKTAVQWAPADERKEIEKMLRQRMREADFEVNYGEFVLFALFSGLESLLFLLIDIVQWIYVYSQPLTMAYHLTDDNVRLAVVVRAKTIKCALAIHFLGVFP